MAITGKVRANAEHLLDTDEVIHAVIPAQTVSQYATLGILAGLVKALKQANRVIVVTDRRILVCRGGRFRITQVGEVLRELPRQTAIGLADGLWYRTDVLGERLYISTLFHREVRQADDMIPK